MNVISHSHARLNLRFLHCKSHHAPLHTYVCYLLSLNSIFVSVSEQKFLHLSDNLNTDRCPPEAKTVLTFFWSVFFFYQPSELNKYPAHVPRGVHISILIQHSTKWDQWSTLISFQNGL